MTGSATSRMRLLGEVGARHLQAGLAVVATMRVVTAVSTAPTTRPPLAPGADVPATWPALAKRPGSVQSFRPSSHSPVLTVSGLCASVHDRYQLDHPDGAYE